MSGNVGSSKKDIQTLQERRDKLRLLMMKTVATGFLGGSLALFLAARTWARKSGWGEALLAFSEAALVGGLADWFAVVALFKHPLGLKIPHTAIIPKNKDRIGDNLGAFIQSHFLTAENILPKIEALDTAKQAGRWLSNRENARQVAGKLSSMLPGLLDALDDERVRQFLNDSLMSRLESLDMASLASGVIDAMTANNRHQALLTDILGGAGQLLDDYREVLAKKFGEKTAWLPAALDRAIINRLADGVQEHLQNVCADEQHEDRVKFDAAVREFSEKLKTSPEYRAKAERLKADLVRHINEKGYVAMAWADLKASLLNDLNSDHSQLKTKIEEWTLSLGRALASDPAIQMKLNGWVTGAAKNILAEHGHHVANLISDQIRKWDAQEMSEKLELQVGRDLQYIRLNGTLVGGLIGLLLFVLSKFTSFL